jgi:hypothetical protein
LNALKIIRITSPQKMRFPAPVHEGASPPPAFPEVQGASADPVPAE